MKESEYAPIILETIGSDGASIRTLKTKCGQGNKISNIRKALYRLLKENKIEVNGYDKEFTNFSYEGIMFRKVNPNITNPIYVKGLLDNPLENNNFFKIQQIFKKHIDDINQIYFNELKNLENIMDKMALKEAIKFGHIKSDDVYSKSHKRRDANKNNEKGIITFNDILTKHPGTEIYYLNEKFHTDLTDYIIDEKKFPNFGSSKYLEYDGSDSIGVINRAFVGKYKMFFSHLPIKERDKKLLFDHFIIDPLKEKGEKKDGRLWGLASLLADDNHVDFVERLRVLEVIHEAEVEHMMDSESPPLWF